MNEHIFKITIGNNRIIEKVIQDENIHYIHMILKKNEGPPDHIADSNIYITVIKGILSLTLNDQGTHEYKVGNVIKVPIHSKMKLENTAKDVLELILIKAPAPFK